MRLTFILILLSVFKLAHSQPLNRTYVVEWLMKCDTSIKIDKINSYFISGNFYSSTDTLKLDSALKRIDHSQLLDILYFSSEEIIETTEVPGRIMVLITLKGQQSSREKKKLFGEAVSKYQSDAIVGDHIPNNSTDPVLVINGAEIFFKNCYNELMKIKQKNIYAISINTKPVPSEYYGQNAKNGLIQIWTR